MAPPSADSEPRPADRCGLEAGDARGNRDADSPLGGVATLILGCGAVGSAFATALHGAGADLLVWSRNGEAAQRLARRLGIQCLAGELPALAAFELVLVAVTDDALAGFIERLAGTDARREPDSGFLFHTNGASGLEPLAPMAGRGWALGKLHPVCAIPSQVATSVELPVGQASAQVLRDAWFASLVSSGGESWATRVIAAVGGRELSLRADPEASLRMHAAAALLSGGLVALFDQACEVARGALDDPDGLRAALLALLQSTAANLANQSAESALTGPIARGSAGTLERHLGLLEGETRDLYRLLGRRMLRLAAQRGELPVDLLRALGDLLR